MYELDRKYCTTCSREAGPNVPKCPRCGSRAFTPHPPVPPPIHALSPQEDRTPASAPAAGTPRAGKAPGERKVLIRDIVVIAAVISAGVLAWQGAHWIAQRPPPMIDVSDKGRALREIRERVVAKPTDKETLYVVAQAFLRMDSEVLAAIYLRAYVDQDGPQQRRDHQASRAYGELADTVYRLATLTLNQAIEADNALPSAQRDATPQGHNLLAALRLPRPTQVASGQLGVDFDGSIVACWNRSKCRPSFPRKPHWPTIFHQNRIQIDVANVGQGCCSVDLDDPDLLDLEGARTRLQGLPARNIPASLTRIGVKYLFISNFLLNSPRV